MSGVINSPKKNVCIVGGGPSGLSALRRVVDSEKLTGTLFELKDNVGGLWNYKGEKALNIVSSNNIRKDGELSWDDAAYTTTMYDNLTTNLPFTSLVLEDFPHTKVSGTFASQKEMHIYFQDYATHFKLWPHIELNTAVVNIRPENPSAPDGDPNARWIVKTRNQKDDTFETQIFDSVIICIGKNTYPHMPNLPGLETFQGTIQHSKYFKTADKFQDQNVVLIGLGPSSGDIAVSISNVVKSATICHKFPLGFKLGIPLPNIKETQTIERVVSDGVITVENEYIKCDSIILCTGYVYRFPFLDKKVGLVVKYNEKYIANLYETLIFTKRPTLAITNVIYRAPEITVSEIQAKFFIAYLEGKVQLPSFEQMEEQIKAEEERKKKEGVQYSEWHQLGTFGMDYWTYCSNLIEIMGFQEEYKLHPLHCELWKTAIMRYFGKFSLYKKDVVKLINDAEWEYFFTDDPDDPESKPRKMVMKVNIENGEFTSEILELQ